MDPESATRISAPPRPLAQARLLRIMIGVVIGLGVLAAAVLVLIGTLGEHDTLYEGRAVYAWAAEIHSNDAARSNTAYLVLNRTIIPQLTRLMFQDTNDSRLRLALIESLNGLPHVNIVFRTADVRRADAAGTLGEFGPAGMAAAPALLQVLQGKDTLLREPAALSLGKLQAEPGTVIPLLIKYLDDDHLDSGAALALAEYGPLAKAALPRLKQLSVARDKDLRHAVAEALSKIEPAATNRDATP